MRKNGALKMKGYGVAEGAWEGTAMAWLLYTLGGVEAAVLKLYVRGGSPGGGCRLRCAGWLVGCAGWCGGWTRTSLYANPRNIQLGRGRAGRWVTAPPHTATLTSLATLTREAQQFGFIF